MINSTIKYVAVDIGGTLSKITFIHSIHHKQFPHLENLTISYNQQQQLQSQRQQQTISGKNYLQNSNKKIFFQYFRSDQIQKTIQYINKYILNGNETLQQQSLRLGLTGGGAFKYLKLFQQNFGQSNITIVNQFDSLLQGIQTIRTLKITQQEFYQMKLGKKKSYGHQQQNQTNIQNSQQINNKQFSYPFFIVNVGSGVSILKLYQQDNQIKCQRVGGTCLGGGFFLGLSRMLIKNSNFSELLELASKGQNNKVDIIPEDYGQIWKQWPDLKNAPVLISLGKLCMLQNSSQNKQLINNPAIVRSLFLMVAYNIAQMVVMHSTIHNINKIVFTGYFCRNNTFMLDCFSKAFSFFQQNTQKCQAYSLKHDGFLGALGSLFLILKNNK